MEVSSRFLIVSDIHLTVPHRWAAFCDQVELGAFLRAVALEDSLTLVLAGDTFDFLMLAGYGGFDASSSPARLASILEHPTNEPVLAGLRAVAKAGHRFVLLSGNHDPEVLLPSVREKFAEVVHLSADALSGEALLHRPADGRAGVWGYRIQAGPQAAFVVHGDRWDVSNYIDREGLLAAATSGNPVTLPAGSKLVYRIIRRLKASGHGWVDQVKPEIESVIPLLLYLDWKTAWAVLKSDWGVTANLLVGLLRFKAGQTNLGAAVEVGAPGPAVPAELLAFVEAMRDTLPKGDSNAILRELAGAEHYPPSRPFATNAATLASHNGFWRWLLRAWLSRVRKSSRFFDRTAQDEVSDHASGTLPPGLALLVAGHTHGERLRTLADPPLRYLNAGTWTPVGTLPPGEIEDVIDELERGEVTTARSPRTVVEILAGTDLQARLLTWHEGRLHERP